MNPYTIEIVTITGNKFYAEISITETGHIVRETQDFDTATEAQAAAETWIAKKLQKTT